MINIIILRINLNMERIIFMKNKRAFTLAEVLITLGVIGVVAAMTMPVLIAKYQEHVTVNKVKKFYSMMSQAILMSINNNGYVNEWNVTSNRSPQSAADFAGYIKPYLKIIKDCGNEPCFNYTENTYGLNKVQLSYNNDRDIYYKLILSDGSYVAFRTSYPTYCTESDAITNICGAVYTDLNGSKQPNTIGIDIFEFPVISTGITTYPLDACNKNSDGWKCTGWILQNGNTDYPARDTD